MGNILGYFIILRYLPAFCCWEIYSLALGWVYHREVRLEPTVINTRAAKGLVSYKSTVKGGVGLGVPYWDVR